MYIFGNKLFTKMSLKPTSFHLLECENTINFITWTYPTLKENFKSLILQTCFSDGLQAVDLFYYKRHQEYWIYIKQFIHNHKKKAVIFLSKVCRPTLYKAICDLFIEKCVSGANGVDLVKMYLKMYITDGIYDKINSPETFLKLKDYPSKTNLKGLLIDLEMPAILIYDALLLKKKILVYHPDTEELQQGLNSITRLVPHRKPEDFLQPLIYDSTDLKQQLLLSLNGTINSNILVHENLFDLLVNLQSLRVDLTSKSKDKIQMTPLHKTIARLMVQLADSDATELEVIQGISTKTNDLYKYLQSRTKREEIPTQDTEFQNTLKKSQKFFISLAKAENNI